LRIKNSAIKKSCNHSLGDEPAKMVRAEKEGATLGPAHGSRKRYKTSVILSERELNA
jgi:hypothetical protein